LPKLSGETDSLQPIRAAQAALVLPITIHEETLGALVLMKRQAGGPWQADDISLASDMVNRGGHVLEKAMLIERIQEADRRKDEFLGMLAHELRNPLGPIRNAVQLLHMTSPKSARLAQAKDIVDRQVAHMARLIDDLLDATRLARGKVLLRSERCDLTQLVRQTAEDYRSIFHASGLKLKTHIPETSLWIQGDPTRLVQAIGNLLHNAHKFTDPGGTITVKLTHQEKNGQAMISIQDTGIGIEPKMLPCIFDVFRQADQGLARSRGGLGLGLALVKGLVELHHGKVKVSSKGPGKGSEFSISLPVEVASYKVEESQAPMPEISKYRILVIEDNRDAAESAQLLLTLEGHRVRVAHNGPEGLEIAKIFLPQVILCDIGLPGMDGYEVARQLRQEPELTGVYIVALTGYGRDEDQRNAQEAGFDLHLTKPIDYSMLRRALAYLPARV
jgi:signal transduction histidine kinase